jgi:hypothetical protein
MRLIVTVGWAIYPLGYFLGYLAGGTACQDFLLLPFCWHSLQFSRDGRDDEQDLGAHVQQA